ncbi:MAG: CopG family antitoxin [bacterium]
MPKVIKKKMPEFKTIEEMVNFLDTHDSTEYDLEPDNELIEMWRTYIKEKIRYKEKRTKSTISA